MTKRRFSWIALIAVQLLGMISATTVQADPTTKEFARTAGNPLLGTKLFVSRVKRFGEAAVELLNPSTTVTYNITGWLISNNVSTEPIGISGNAWSILKPLETRVLRRGEPGSFTFQLDELSVIYLYDENFDRVEQLGWSRPDQISPDLCVTRLQGTGGTHDGSDWFTCGGQDNISVGELRYAACPPDMLGPPIAVGDGPQSSRSLMVFPNPASSTSRVTVSFSLRQEAGMARSPVRIRLVNPAGKLIKTLVNDALVAGYYSLTLNVSQGEKLHPGVYFVQIDAPSRSQSVSLVIGP